MKKIIPVGRDPVCIKIANHADQTDTEKKTEYKRQKSKSKQVAKEKIKTIWQKFSNVSTAGSKNGSGNILLAHAEGLSKIFKAKIKNTL